MHKAVLRGALIGALLSSLAACGGSSADSASSDGTNAGGSNSTTTSGSGNSANAAAVVALSSQLYTVPASSTSATIAVERSGDPSGEARVDYRTVNGTATAGADYASTSGTLAWADGDATPKTIAIPVSTAAAGKAFSLALVTASGSASLGEPNSATIAVSGSSTTASTPSTTAGTPSTTAGTPSTTAGTPSTTASTPSTTASTPSTTSGSSTSSTQQSASGTLVGSSGQIVDASLNTWKISNGVVYAGTTPAGYSANVVDLLYYGGTVYQENSACQWWSWNGSTWVSATDPDPSTTAAQCSSSATASSAGTLGFSAATYSVTPSAGSIVVTVDRIGGSAGAASIAYATVAGTAKAGTDYTAASGTLSWAAGDATAKTFTVAISTSDAGGKSFTATLSGATGASLGTTSTATLSIAAAAASTGLSIRAQGNQLVDGNGNAVQMRGANISVLESLFLSPTGNYWQGANLGTYPWWGPIQAWGINAVRIPLNEATWLRYQGADIMNLSGGTQTPDASGNYQAIVKQAVKDANALGIYVILDLHWTAPGTYLANTQDQLPDADHSIAFWTSLAQTFGNNPGVIFDLFNEPYPSTKYTQGSQNPYQILLNGSTQTAISYNSGNSTLSYTWTSVGMQQLVNTIRSAGATNLLMVGGAGGATDLSGYTTAGGGYVPTDPLKNIAVSWHAYGVSSASFTMSNAGWNATINPTSVANAILAQGLPIVIGEVGDNSSNGTASAPVMSYMQSWADAHGQSILPWSWDVWSSTGGSANLLIKDAAGTPTDGEGVAYKAWLSQH